MMKRSCSHLCPRFQVALDVLAKPWNGLLIATLAPGPLRFGELSSRLSGIGDRMLSLRLKELQSLGLLVRRILPGPPVGVEYELTAAGHGFGDVADAIGTWGEMLTPPEPPKKATARAGGAKRDKVGTRERVPVVRGEGDASTNG
jgi:DNA-binding HxlR family transcriptional regulator